MPDRPTDDGPGPRRPDMVRKTLWLDTELEELLREEALTRETTEAAIVRRLLRQHYGLD